MLLGATGTGKTFTIANVNRARTQKIRRVRGKVWWAKRQVVEGVISQIKLFNAGSGWRTLSCVLVYVYAYAIGYSYYRRGELEV